MSPPISRTRPPVVRSPPPPPRAPEGSRTPPPEMARREVDAFEPAGTSSRPLSRLERRPEVQALPETTRARIHGIETGASRAEVTNLTQLVTARGFGQLAPERQAEMLDVFSRHPDRRTTRSLTHLANNRAFRESEPAAQTAAIREAAIPPRLRADALTVLNTTTPDRVTVNGVPIDVFGASAGELQTITHTLERLPPEHLRAIPRIVVADTIGHGSADSGGAWLPESAIRHYERGAPGIAAGYTADGWRNLPRLEFSRESLNREEVMESHVSNTVLHETGHAVDARYELTRGMTQDDLGNVRYGGSHTDGSDPRGPVTERFADAYMSYYLGGFDRRDPAAFRTVEEAIARVPASP